MAPRAMAKPTPRLGREGRRRASSASRLTATWLDALYVARVARGRASARRCSTWSSRSARRLLSVGVRVQHARPPLLRADTASSSSSTPTVGNEEHAPDVRMAWARRRLAAFYRRLIDEVDLLLGDVLARRVALTRVVQDAKRAVPPCRPARDDARSARRRVAERPELGAGVRRIMHKVIGESETRRGGLTRRLSGNG